MAVFESQADNCPLIGIRFASSGTFFIKKTEKRLLDLGVCRIPELIQIQPLFFSGSGSRADFPGPFLLLCFGIADWLLVRGGPPGHPTQGVSLCQFFSS